MKPPLEVEPLHYYPSLTFERSGIVTPHAWLYHFPNNYGLSVLGGVTRPTCRSNGIDTYEVTALKYILTEEGEIAQSGKDYYCFDFVTEDGKVEGEDTWNTYHNYVDSQYIARLALKVSRLEKRG